MVMDQHRTLSPPVFLWLKRIIFMLSLTPFIALGLRALGGQLGVNPVETLTRSTGIWALNFLMITLAITPVRMFFGWMWLVRLRRMLGLFCFSYASLHVATYLIFDQFFDWAGMVKDVIKRPYITAGVFTFAVLFPLALTSTDAMVRRLGKRWKRLHRLVYLAGIGGALHYLWLVKRDITDPACYILVLCFLLCTRMMWPRSAGSTTPTSHLQKQGRSAQG
jgi:sulfoxide reductase heme-binding subunit YedZ